MREPELILATLANGEAALFVNSDAVLSTGAERPEIAAKYLAKALGVGLRAVQLPLPDYPEWSWNDVYAAIAPPGNPLDTVGPAKDRPGTDADGRARALAALRADGLTIGECIKALAVPDDDPYVTAARALILGSDDIEIDDDTTISVGENGAWVLAWLWISDEEAGVLSNSAVLEQVLDHARRALAGSHGLDPDTAKLRAVQAGWLEEVLSNFADEIDEIASTRPVSAPGAILWIDEQGRDALFMPSDALFHLLRLARSAGLPVPVAEQSERFRAQYGDTLDAILRVIQVG